MFKKGDLVVCIDKVVYGSQWKNPTSNLTIGKTYSVLFSNSPLYGEDTYILITSDDGGLHAYNSKFFIGLDVYRNNKINDILK